MPLFDDICEPRNVTAAYYRARKGLACKSVGNVFEARLEHEVDAICQELHLGLYQFGQYQKIVIHDPKERKILVAPFRDRIVHHAINWHVAPILERSWIFDSYACRKGKGNQKALARLQQWLDGKPMTYVLKMDIKQYFASVRRDTLLAILSKKISDIKVMQLLERLITTAPAEDQPYRGIPIGNLTSQTFANTYLDVLDHYVKDTLGVRHYLRYVDDFVAFGDKRALHELRHRIVDFLHRRLDLAVDPSKNRILMARNGLPFLGFVLRPNQRPRLRRASIKRFTWSIRRARCAGLSEGDLAIKVASWYAYARLADVRTILSRTDTFKYVEKIL